MARAAELGVAELGKGDENWATWNAKAIKAGLVEWGTKHDTMKHVMQVYETSVWGKGSGAAPSLAYTTICMLTRVVEMMGVTLIVDSPCGDQHWAPILRALNPKLKYIGVDVMPGLVLRNRQTFGVRGHSNCSICSNPTCTASCERTRRPCSNRTMWCSF
jgi:hypothetical protein